LPATPGQLAAWYSSMLSGGFHSNPEATLQCFQQFCFGIMLSLIEPALGGDGQLQATIAAQTSRRLAKCMHMVIQHKKQEGRKQ
jgi:hypothetical protein